MATRKLSSSKLLRCRYLHTLRIVTSSISSPSNYSSIEPHHFANTPYRNFVTHDFYRHGDVGGFLRPYKYSSTSSCYRSFSTNGKKATDVPEVEELSGSGFFDYEYGSGGDAEITDAVSGAAVIGEESFLPVRCLVWFLDKVHDLSGMPWWMVIVISTLALRVMILPLHIVQLRKLGRIGELLPK